MGGLLDRRPVRTRYRHCGGLRKPATAAHPITTGPFKRRQTRGSLHWCRARRKRDARWWYPGNPLQHPSGGGTKSGERASKRGFGAGVTLELEGRAPPRRGAELSRGNWNLQLRNPWGGVGKSLGGASGPNHDPTRPGWDPTGARGRAGLSRRGSSRPVGRDRRRSDLTCGGPWRRGALRPGPLGGPSRGPPSAGVGCSRALNRPRPAFPGGKGPARVGGGRLIFFLSGVGARGRRSADAPNGPLDCGPACAEVPEAGMPQEVTTGRRLRMVARELGRFLPAAGICRARRAVVTGS